MRHQIQFFGNDVETVAVIFNSIYLVSSVDFTRDYQWEELDEIPEGMEDCTNAAGNPMELIPAELFEHIERLDTDGSTMTCEEYIVAFMANQTNKDEWAAGYPDGLSMEDLHHNDTIDIGLGTKHNDIDPAYLNNLPGNWNELGDSVRITDLEENFDTRYDITPATGEYYWYREVGEESWRIIGADTPEQAMAHAAAFIDWDIEIGAGRYPEIAVVYFRADGEWVEN